MSMPNIPGFYFDPEKNRYFKILSDRQGHTAHSVTTSTVKARNAYTSSQTSAQSDTEKAGILVAYILGLYYALTSCSSMPHHQVFSNTFSAPQHWSGSCVFAR